MFADALAGRIFRVVQALTLAGSPVSAISVQAAMAESGQAGSAVPGWNRGNVVSPSDAAPLAARVRECWGRREMAALGERIGGIAAAQGMEAALRELAAAQALLQAKPTQRGRSMLELTAAYTEELHGQLANPGDGIAFETGFRVLDKHTGGLRVGELFVIAARPSQGKTALVVSILAHLARTGVPCGAFWLEDDWRDAVRRYHQARHFVVGADLRGPPAVALARMNDVATRAMDEQERIVIDDTHGLTVNEIAARMRRMHREHGTRVFFADHLGEMAIERSDRWGDRHDLALGAAARIFRDTAKELRAVPVLCSQMNRQVERRTDHTPLMSDLDGSGQVEQAARVLAFVSQPANEDGTPTGELVLNLAKNKDGRKGPVKLRWVPERMAVVDP